MSVSYPPIPYGLGHFPTVRRDGFYYVDRRDPIDVLNDGDVVNPHAKLAAQWRG